MLFNQTYKMIVRQCEGFSNIKGSKFYAFAYPVKDELQIKQQIKSIKDTYPDASHHCYAWVLGYDGQNFRTNDDGEPSNTAGKPIYRQIQKLHLSNILVIVIRYFGGTMLGVPGLIEAYGNVTAECLKKAEIIEHQIFELYKVKCPFGMENEIYRICKQYQAELNVINQLEYFSAQIRIPLHKVDAFSRQLGQLYQLSIEYIGLE